MKIKPKFELGEKVYFLYGGHVRTSKIGVIQTKTYYPNKQFKKPITKIEYVFPEVGGAIIPQNSVYSTEQSLIENTH